MLEDGKLFWAALKLLFALPVVIILAHISLKLTNQYVSKRSMGKNIQVIERVPIDNKSSLLIAKIGEEYIALAMNEGSFQVIKKMKREEMSLKESENNQSYEVNFKDALNFKKLKDRIYKHE